MQAGQLGRGSALFDLRARQQCGVGSVGALGVNRVVVGGLVILDRGLGVAAVLVQQLRQQEVVARGFAVLRERGQHLAVPAHRFVDIGHGLGLLRAGVVVACECREVGLDEGLRRRFPAGVVAAAELAAGAVALHVFLLRAQRQRRQAAALVDADHARLQHGGLGVQRLAAGEGAEGVGGILGPVLLDVQLAELFVDAELVGAARVVADERRDRFGAAQVGQADAGDAQGVFDQLAVGARQTLHALERFVAAAGDLQVEHAEEGLQPVFEPALLVQGPAVHVEGAVLEGRGRGALDQAGVGLLRFGVLRGVEQQLAAAKLGLVAEAGLRVIGDELVERGQGHFELPAKLVRARQLVQHAVVVRIVRVGLEVVLVLLDRALVVGVGAGVGALVVGALHRQVAQAALGLGALRCARRHIEKTLVGGRGLLGADRHHGIGPRGRRCGDGARGQSRQGRFVVGRALRLAGAGCEQDSQGDRCEPSVSHDRHSWPR